MEKQEFLKRVETELKISKASPYTINKYLYYNSSLLDFLNKDPETIKDQDVKLFLAEKLASRASMSIILFLAAVRYAYTSILKVDPTLGIKRPKREKAIPVVLSREEVKTLLDSIENKKTKLPQHNKPPIRYGYQSYYVSTLVEIHTNSPCKCAN